MCIQSLEKGCQTSMDLESSLEEDEDEDDDESLELELSESSGSGSLLGWDFRPLRLVLRFFFFFLFFCFFFLALHYKRGGPDPYLHIRARVKSGPCRDMQIRAL